MALLAVPLVTVAALLLFGLPHSAVSAASEDCTYVEYTEDKCRSADTITVADQVIRKGTKGKRIKLHDLETEVPWFCGSTKERTAWGAKANQLRVNYESDGTIQWTVYKCNDLSGPKSAGLKCGIPESTQPCPKFNDKSPPCLWELKTTHSKVHSKTTTVNVDVSLKAEVTKYAAYAEAKATAEVTAGVEQSVTDASIFTFESKTFLLIPAGYTYCSLSENTSVGDVHSPTGFRWQCSFTKFVQMKGKANNGMCSSLEMCSPGVCGAPNTSKAPGVSIPVGISVLTLSLVASSFTLLL